MGPILAAVLFFSPMLLIHVAANVMGESAQETAAYCSTVVGSLPEATNVVP